MNSVAMYATGFNPAVAAAHGVQYQWRGNLLTLTEPDGSSVEYTVGSPNAKAGAGPTPLNPNNTVGGNCGTSTYEIYNEDDGGDALIYYGFDLNSAAVAYTASAYAVNEWTGDVFTDSHRGGLNFRTHWGHDWELWTGYGEVAGGAYLTATLWYGVTCTSNDPTDSNFIS